MSNHFKNDLNIIEHNQSNFSHEHQSPSNSYLQDEEDEIIQSMNEKQKLLKQLQVLKAQVKSQGNVNTHKSTTKNNKLSKAQHNKLSAKINTINSGTKKASSSNQQKKFQSINHKPSKQSMFNSLSTKTVITSKSRPHLLDQFKSKKT